MSRKWWAQKVVSAAVIAIAIGGVFHWIAESRLTPPVVTVDESIRVDKDQRWCDEIRRGAPESAELQKHFDELRKTERYRDCKWEE